MPDQSSEQPLSGQQMSAMQKQFADKLSATIKDVDLRKWSVDQACALAGTALEHGATSYVDPAKPMPDVVNLAKSIHAFLTEEAKL